MCNFCFRKAALAAAGGLLAVLALAQTGHAEPHAYGRVCSDGNGGDAFYSVRFVLEAID